MQPPMWCAPFIGIPYIDYGRNYCGLDCWGLVRLVILERTGIELPLYSTDPKDNASVHREINTEKKSGRWLNIKADNVQALDVAVIATPCRLSESWEFVPLHVGIIVSPEWLLHTERATGAVLQKLEEGFMKRIESVWRLCPMK